jgi:hypothetical protein
MADDNFPSGFPALERVMPMPEVVAATSLSEDSLDRHYPHWIVHLSPRRRGMKVKHVLQITDGK